MDNSGGKLLVVSLGHCVARLLLVYVPLEILDLLHDLVKPFLVGCALLEKQLVVVFQLLAFSQRSLQLLLGHLSSFSLSLHDTPQVCALRAGSLNVSFEETGLLQLQPYSLLSVADAVSVLFDTGLLI